MRLVTPTGRGTALKACLLILHEVGYDVIVLPTVGDTGMSFQAVDNMPPVHPGELLRDELEALKMGAVEFAAYIGEPMSAVTDLLDEQRGISGLMALKLSRAFGTTPEYWLNLNDMYETKQALSTHALAIASIQPLRPHSPSGLGGQG